ncbi:hypothetical protein LB566_21855 [Mesorhizobium sp. CA13]|uniref:antibiotic biosynthesis monooxygenase n=1 Tax=unclassified Mesorhizobium TaxID=325217 RepID=UPI001129AD80|nr:MULTISPECIES: antibiotic biosynthesis monooxygenase [unclassified Mesorhizobium]MBZ9856454.1 hypothetical protein [Mesorhizobium sp. CA13]MBZ9921875.1 hypothetical protein [Mesorhizobium sp. BR1-1-7]MBZ9965799.1 hypothetical protein [Mesorhizobium sp. BR1-1-2]MCA0011916.1 hypothetical protein [Mesorhizobium sp. B294B1A1]MCA0038170.1 hypothetical protein [Mesorhizobium sp. B292B1B]
MEVARKAASCRDFIVAADPIEDDRVNVDEVWETVKAMLAFRGDRPDSGMNDLIVEANVDRHSVKNRGPAWAGIEQRGDCNDQQQQ